jgi:hypothetical protein
MPQLAILNQSLRFCFAFCLRAFVSGQALCPATADPATDLHLL